MTFGLATGLDRMTEATTSAPTGPVAELDPRYGEPEATATSWDDACRLLSSAEVSWLSTVRPDGRPHVTPLLTVWHDGALHFCTGPGEQKARNLAACPQVCLVAGRGDVQVVVEGTADRITSPAVLGELARSWRTEHGWHFGVDGDAFTHAEGGRAHVFAVRPQTARGFGTGEPYSQTRWTFTHTEET